jgi:hypothetical protein
MAAQRPGGPNRPMEQRVLSAFICVHLCSPLLTFSFVEQGGLENQVEQG